jgi:two-component system, sporulation sensor kinase E
MLHKKASSLDRVLGRLDNLDAVNLTNLVQRLARERSLLEAVFNVVREGILIIDKEGFIEYANAAASLMVGLREGDLGATTLWKLVPDLARTLEGEAGGKLSPPPTFLKELYLSYPERRYVRLYLTPFEEETLVEESVTRFAVILTDITKEKESTEEWVESERVQSILLLAAGVAHELGNPLNSLNIHLQLVQRALGKLAKTSETAKIRKSLDICESEVVRLNGIITHFLEAIRPAPPDLQEINLIEILEEVLQFQATELDDRSIRVDVELNQKLPVVLGDRNQLKQVFFNLTKNSMEAMRAGGTIRVTTRSDDRCIYLHFGDSGGGIKQDEIGRVFEPYFTTKKTGSGLGLMIVERILRNHGGNIAIESKEGVGTVISLQFPHKDRRVRLLEG